MSYSQIVMEYYNNTQNVGSMDINDDTVGTGLVGDPSSGDVVKLQIRVNAQHYIKEAKYRTFGCGSAIAVTEFITGWVQNKSLEEAATINETMMIDHLGLPPNKVHCAVVVKDALIAAILNYKNKHKLITQDELVIYQRLSVTSF